MTIEATGRRITSTALLPASAELTDAEILDRYGPLLEGAVAAFRDDPTYLIQMAESAALMRAKRAKRAG